VNTAVVCRFVCCAVAGGTTNKCTVIDHNTGSEIIIMDDNEFGPNYVSIHERGYDAETGARIFGSPTPDVLNRTRNPCSSSR